MQGDAAKYTADQSKPIHIVIAEVMQNALKNEPQVAVAMNLAPQIQKDGILIPESIEIDAALIDRKRDMERIQGVEGADKDYCYPLGRVYCLYKETAAEKALPKVTLEISDNIPTKYYRLSLLTSITVFGEHRLNYCQCSLNLPHKVLDLREQENPISEIHFKYEMSGKPHFSYKINT